MSKQVTQPVRRISKEIGRVAMNLHHERHRADDLACWLEHPVGLLENSSGIGDVFQDLRHHYRVARAVPDRQCHRIGHYIRCVTRGEVDPEPPRFRPPSLVVEGGASSTHIKHQTADPGKEPLENPGKVFSVPGPNPVIPQRVPKASIRHLHIVTEVHECAAASYTTQRPLDAYAAAYLNGT